MPKQIFPRTYNKTDFGVTADIDVVNGKWTIIAELQVPAQQEIAWGVGQASFNGVDTRKNVTIDVESVTGDLDGVYRLALANANKTDIRIVMEDRSENTASGVALGETKARAKEDSYLIIYMNPDSDSTIDFDASGTTMLLPATVYQ